MTPPDAPLVGAHVRLRAVTLDDCGDRYVAWLADPEVNRYLETRWRPQTIEAIRAYVSAVETDPGSHLFAVVERETERHVGNLKVGPVRHEHGYADLSYFIGERDVWGRGYATEAIRLAADWAFDRLGLRMLEAGCYAGNVASRRALEKAGFELACTFPEKLRGPDGFEDHVWYRLVNPAVGWTRVGATGPPHHAR